MTPRSLIIFTAVVFVAVAILVAPWGSPPTPASTPARGTTTNPPAAPPAAHMLRGESARAAAAVQRLIGALRNGDVDVLCRPGALLTPAVVEAMNQDGMSCEADVEAELSASSTKPIGLLGITTEPDMATARMRAAGGDTVPVTLLRDGSRWLVSFSHGGDPVSALTA